MKIAEPLQFHQKFGLAWLFPVAVYWLFLFVATRDADPMAFHIIFVAAVLVPVMNTWTLIPKFKTRTSAIFWGCTVPALSLAVVLGV